MLASFATLTVGRVYQKFPICRFIKRAFLPETYHCNQLWNSRLHHEAFTHVSARDLGLVLLRAIDSKQTVSSLDYDIFANKLHELDTASLDFAESVIRKYASTQSAVQVVDSTVHALIRGFIGFDRADKLLDLLNQRSETAVFLDNVSANLLLDYFLEHQEWESAISVAWELYLQDDSYAFFSIPLTLALSLHAAQKRIQCPWLNEDVDNEVTTDSDDVEYKFVKYVRNANYDGLFDIDRPRLKLGFLLLHLVQALSAFVPPSLEKSASSHNAIEKAKRLLPQGLRLFGLACSDQMSALYNNLQQLTTSDQLQVCGLSPSVFERLVQIVGSAKSRADDSSPGYREPVLPTQTELDAVMNELKRLLNVAKSSNDCFFAVCSEFVHEGVLGNAGLMKKETEAVERMYAQFEKNRDRIWREHLSTSKKYRTIAESKKCLRELLDEEERLTYFKHAEEVMHNAWLAPRTSEERKWSKMKQWRQDILKLQEKAQGRRPIK